MKSLNTSKINVVHIHNWIFQPQRKIKLRHLQKNEWVEQEIIRINEISQIHKDKNCIFFPYDEHRFIFLYIYMCVCRYVYNWVYKSWKYK